MEATFTYVRWFDGTNGSYSNKRDRKSGVVGFRPAFLARVKELNIRQSCKPYSKKEKKTEMFIVAVSTQDVAYANQIWLLNSIHTGM